MATKPDGNKFSLTYFLFGEGKTDWLRTLGDDARRLMIYGLVFLVVYFVWTTFFPRKPQSNVNKPEQTVVVTPGAKVNRIEQTSTNIQKSNEKRPWWFPIPFAEVFGGVRNKGTDSSKFEPDYGARAGVRIDFL
jgi:hypothetical protein